MENLKEYQFKIGDIVTHKLGSRRMIVTNMYRTTITNNIPNNMSNEIIEVIMVRCNWLDSEHSNLPVYAEFEEYTLDKY